MEDKKFGPEDVAHGDRIFVESEGGLGITTESTHYVDSASEHRIRTMGGGMVGYGQIVSVESYPDLPESLRPVMFNPSRRDD